MNEAPCGTQRGQILPRSGRKSRGKELRLGSGVVSLCPPLLASTIFT